MRTIDRLTSTAPVSWSRAQAGRLRRALRDRHPAVRWALAVAAVSLGLAAAVYLGAASLVPDGRRYLASGRSFSTEDLTRIRREFDSKNISFRVDREQRVEVPAEQYELAFAAFKKLDIGPRTIDEIRNQSTASSLLDGPREREQRLKIAREKELEAIIDGFDSVAWSHVSVREPPPAAGFHARSKPSAFVLVETEADRQLTSQTVQAIASLLTLYVHGLTAESIAVWDHRGHPLLDPGDPMLSVNSRSRAREELIREKILQKLDWIKGLRVDVKLFATEKVEPDVGRASATRPEPTVHRDGAGPGSRPGVGPSTTNGVPSRSTPFTPTIVVNSPMELGPELPPATELPPLVTGAQPGSPAREGVAVAHSGGAAPTNDRSAAGTPRPPAATVADAAAGAGANPAGIDPSERGHVLINVPRSYYFSVIIPEHHEPTVEELKRFAAVTKDHVLKTVSLVVPKSWEVDVETLPDKVPQNRPTVVSSSPDPRRLALDWGIVAAIGAGVSVLVAVGSWVQVARRPGRPIEPVAESRRYHPDSASEPGPSERVRELVRRNPEAAASVLERWTTQGGHVS